MEKKSKEKNSWKIAKGLGGNFEYNPTTNEVRMKDSKKIVKNLLYSPENSDIKEFRGDLENYLSEYEDVEVEIKLNRKKPKNPNNEELYSYSEMMDLLEMFMDEAMETKGYIVVHRDGDRSNNRVDNLKYVPYNEVKYYYGKEVVLKDRKSGKEMILNNVAEAADYLDEDPEIIYNEVYNIGENEDE